jgi:hypothetical protein
MANSTSPVPQVLEGTGAAAKINTLFDAGSQTLIGGRDAITTTLLVWGFLGGRVNGTDKASGTVTLTASNTNYVVMAKSGLAVSVSTATTNWNDSANYWRLYSVVTGATAVTSYNDERFSTLGLFSPGLGSTLSNPMTDPADMIVGGVGGAATKLAKGSALQTLRMNAGGTAQEWATPGAAAATAIPIACSDEVTPLTTGTAKVTFRMPFAFTLTAVRASLTTAQASGSIFTVDINEGGASILSTKITIDNTEKTSTTAAAAPVISDTALADDAEITIDIDQVGNGSATGLKVYLIGNP